METKTKSTNKIIKDIQRLENDIYRIIAWEGRDGKSFLSLHVFFKKNGKFHKTREGIHIPADLRIEIAKALIAVKNAPELPLPGDGKKWEAALLTAIPVSENEEYQISKVRGFKNQYVRICRAFKGRNGTFVPNARKALSILESSVDDLAETLVSDEAAPLKEAVAV